jgi:uncharacterized membrane protein YjjP (DUF1212 family)
MSQPLLPLHTEETYPFPPLSRRATSPAHPQSHQQRFDRLSPSLRKLSFMTPAAPSLDSSTAMASSSSFKSTSSTQQEEAHDVFQNALRLALSAYEYGCVGYRIEVFLERILLDRGYECSIMVTNVELIASVYSYRWRKRRSSKKTKDNVTKQEQHASSSSMQQPVKDSDSIDDDNVEVEHFLPITIAVPLEDGANLYKLGILSFVCHQVKYKELSLSQAVQKLEEIEALPPPYTMVTRWLAYVGTSVGFVAILGGSWLDLLVSIVGSSMTFAVVQIFSAYYTRDTIQRLNVTWQNFFAAFFPALLASSVTRISSTMSSVNVVTVAISCIISEVPGFMLIKGISELARNRMLAGFGHFTGALFISFWLGLGGWVGIETIKIAFGPTVNEQGAATPIQDFWLFLFGPLLCCSFAIFFNVGPHDLILATLVGLVALGMAMTIPMFPNAMFGNFLSAFATSLASHLCSCFAAHGAMNDSRTTIAPPRPHIPESIFGLPAFFTLACGSMGKQEVWVFKRHVSKDQYRRLVLIMSTNLLPFYATGFLGFLGLLEGDSSSGTQAFERMLTFTFMLVFGVYVGGTVLPTKAILNAW